MPTEHRPVQRAIYFRVNQSAREITGYGKTKSNILWILHRPLGHNWHKTKKLIKKDENIVADYMLQSCISK
jgi:hypothetical protein